MNDPKSICEHLLGKEKAEEFSKWAIGKDFKNVAFPIWPKIWNKFHGKKLKLKKSGIIEIDIPKMIEIWKTDENIKF